MAPHTPLRAFRAATGSHGSAPLLSSHNLAFLPSGQAN